MKRLLVFAAKVTFAHVITYFVFGAMAYGLLTKEFYVGPNAVFASFMRTEAEPELWRHVMTWFLPGQVLRGALIALALYPFLDTLNGWSFAKRTITLSGLYLIIGFWAAATAAPGTIDGLIYLRPEITPAIHFKVQLEIILQGVAMSALIAWWMGAANRLQPVRQAAAMTS